MARLLVDHGQSSVASLVNEPLDYAYGRVVDEPDGFAAALALDSATKAKRAIRNVHLLAAHRALRLGTNIIKFVRHDDEHTTSIASLPSL